MAIVYMEIDASMILTILCSVLASSGFWMYLTKRTEKKDVKRDMLIGLAHDRIMTLGMYYIRRQSITAEEYENLYEYLFVPYKALGGNGSAERIMKEVNKLQIKQIDIDPITSADIVIDH